jgi:hypothetical protein
MLLMLPQIGNIISSWLGDEIKKKMLQYLLMSLVSFRKQSIGSFGYLLGFVYLQFTLLHASAVLPVVITQDNKTIYTLIEAK